MCIRDRVCIAHGSPSGELRMALLKRGQVKLAPIRGWVAGRSLHEAQQRRLRATLRRWMKGVGDPGHTL